MNEFNVNYPNNAMQTPTDTLKVVVKKAHFRETGTYNPVFMRPYKSSITELNQRQLIEATHGGQSITPSILSGFANEFLQPDASYQQVSRIDEGWDTPRFRFIIEVEYHSIHQNFYQGQPPKTKIIQGYTTHVGYSPNGAIDPSMGLRFNTIITLRHSVEQTPFGPTLRTTVAQADHVLHDQWANAQQQPQQAFYTDQPQQQPWTNWMMRPEDVFRSIGAEIMVRGANQSDEIYDMRNSLISTPIGRSKRKNSLAPHYVSEILNAYNHSHMNYDQNYTDGLGYAEVMHQAEGHVQEQSVIADEFFRKIKQQSVNFDQTGGITYGELCSIFPDFDQAAVFTINPPVQKQQPVHHHGETEFWNTSTNETIWATSLSHAIPAIMMDLMLKNLTLTATNRTPTGEHFVQFLDARSFIDHLDNLNSYLNHFRWQFIGEVLKGLSMHNQIDYELSVMIDVAGETRITLSLMGGPMVDYATPSFCDGLFIPVITTNQDNLTALAYDMSALAGHIQSNTGVSYV